MLEVTQEHGVAVVAPRIARLDARAAPGFKAQVLDVVASAGGKLVLDLAGVEFMDSSGLGTMVSILKALGPQGAMAVCNVGGEVQALFRLTRMDRVFPIEANREAAFRRVTG